MSFTSAVNMPGIHHRRQKKNLHLKHVALVRKHNEHSVTYVWKRVPLIVAPLFQGDQFIVLLRFLIEKRTGPVLIFELALKSSMTVISQEQKG
jgi:hypothetical protein